MRRFWKRWLMQREVNRRIPHAYDWYMTEHEKMRWRVYGWRVTYWVCPLCGARLTEENKPWRANRAMPPAHLCATD